MLLMAYINEVTLKHYIHAYNLYTSTLSRVDLHASIQYLHCTPTAGVVEQARE